MSGILEYIRKRKTRPSPAARTVDGVFDGVDGVIAHGWARLPDEPERRVVVEIVDGDRVVGRGVAQRYREDLRDAGIGDGGHGFRIALPRGLLDQGAHRLHARVAGEPGRLDGEVSVEGGPEADASAVEGILDGVDGHVAHGWACAPGDPERRLAVEIVEGDRVVGRGVADIYREDLRLAGIGDGNHGFRIRLSRVLLDGRMHRLHARAARGGAMLHGEVALEFADDDRFAILPAQETVAAARAAPGEAAADEAFQAALADASFKVEIGEYEAALESLRELDGLYPGNSLVRLKIAEALTGDGQDDAAMSAYRALSQSGADVAPWAWLGQGDAYRALGQWHEADRCYREGLQHAPDMPLLRRRAEEVVERNTLIRARRELGDGKPADALAMLGPLLWKRPDDARVQELVAEAVALRREAAGDAGAALDPEMAAVRRELDLLVALSDYAHSCDAAR